MSGEVEYGKCDICGKESSLSRKYYRYDIKCDCCNGIKDDHFEIVRYCSECKPKPPRVAKVIMTPNNE